MLYHIKVSELLADGIFDGGTYMWGPTGGSPRWIVGCTISVCVSMMLTD